MASFKENQGEKGKKKRDEQQEEEEEKEEKKKFPKKGELALASSTKGTPTLSLSLSRSFLSIYKQKINEPLFFLWNDASTDKKKKKKESRRNLLLLG